MEMENIKKSEFIDRLYNEKLEFTKADIDTFYKAFVECIADCIVEGKKVRLPGLGTFSMKLRNPRECHDPRNPEERFTAPAKYAPHFKPAADFKARCAKVEIE